MKTIMRTILAALLMAGATYAADQAAPAVQYYDAGFEGNTFFRAVTKDLATADYGAGLGVTYFANESLGAGVEVSGEDVEGLLVEQMEARGIWRLAYKRAALVNFIGYAHDFNNELHGFTLGGGPEYRFTKRFGLYGEIGLVKWLDEQVDRAPYAVAKVGARFNF